MAVGRAVRVVGFGPLGALALGAEIMVPGLSGLGAVQHFWMAGAIGVMTLGVMTRASLGRTGQTLSAGKGTVLIYCAVVLATVLRISAGLWPSEAMALYTVSGALWIVGFGGFAALYGPVLLRATSARAD